MLSLTGNPLFVHQRAPRHARGAAVCTSVWQIPVKQLCSGLRTRSLSPWLASFSVQNCLCLAHWLEHCLCSPTCCQAPARQAKQDVQLGAATFSNHILRGFPPPAHLWRRCLDTECEPEHREIHLQGESCNATGTRMLQLIATSVVGGSQRASHYHFSDDHKSQEKHRKVTKKKKEQKPKGGAGREGTSCALLISEPAGTWLKC